MNDAAICFDGVWKKFRRGERHDSLRDLIPSLARRALRRRRDALDAKEFWALKDVSFEVRPGHALGIIGPNGAGKSTALKLLTRILRPTRGSCSVRGRVGALIEVAAGFHPDLTGRENVYLQGAILGMKRGEIARKFDEIVDFAGLGEFMDTPVKRYSSGMNARLGFSIAAHLDPEVLLIDEVLAVGDMSFQQRCLDRLAQFRRDGMAIAFVSHNMQAVATLCDTALLLRPNQPAVLDDVGTVTSAYASASTAAGDSRVEVVSARLTAPGQERGLTRAVRPGSDLQLEIELRPKTDLPQCAVGLLVSRSDGVLIFDGTATVEGVAPVHLPAGTRVRYAIRFRANLLRATYFIGISLSDARQTWLPVQLPALSSFVVTDPKRRIGCAELEPRYEVAVLEEVAASLS